MQAWDWFNAKVLVTVENKINFAANHWFLAAQPLFWVDKLHNFENLIYKTFNDKSSEK